MHAFKYTKQEEGKTEEGPDQPQDDGE